MKNYKTQPKIPNQEWKSNLIRAAILASALIFTPQLLAENKPGEQLSNQPVRTESIQLNQETPRQIISVNIQEELKKYQNQKIEIKENKIIIPQGLLDALKINNLSKPINFTIDPKTNRIVISGLTDPTNPILRLYSDLIRDKIVEAAKNNPNFYTSIQGFASKDNKIQINQQIAINIDPLKEDFDIKKFEVPGLTKVNISSLTKNGTFREFCTGSVYSPASLKSWHNNPSTILLTATHCLPDKTATIYISEESPRVGAYPLKLGLGNTVIYSSDIAMIVPNNSKAINDARILIEQMNLTERELRTNPNHPLAVTTSRQVNNSDIGNTFVIPGRVTPTPDRKNPGKDLSIVQGQYNLPTIVAGDYSRYMQTELGITTLGDRYNIVSGVSGSSVTTNINGLPRIAGVASASNKHSESPYDYWQSGAKIKQDFSVIDIADRVSLGLQLKKVETKIQSNSSQPLIEQPITLQPNNIIKNDLFEIFKTITYDITFNNIIAPVNDFGVLDSSATVDKVKFDSNVSIISATANASDVQYQGQIPIIANKLKELFGYKFQEVNTKTNHKTIPPNKQVEFFVNSAYVQASNTSSVLRLVVKETARQLGPEFTKELAKVLE